jgi:hypothetical protein
MMMGTERLVVGVSDGPRAFTPRSKLVVSFICWSGIVSCDSVTSKDPCWYSFRLSGGGGGSSVTGGKPRIIRDWRSL